MSISIKLMFGLNENINEQTICNAQFDITWTALFKKNYKTIYMFDFFNHHNTLF